MINFKSLKHKIVKGKQGVEKPIRLNLIDIGSAGELPSPWKENIGHIGSILAFEPREEMKIKKNIICKNVALWEKKCSKKFYIYKGLSSSGSSLFKQDYNYVRNNYMWLKMRGNPELAETWFERSRLLKTKTVQCNTLDNVLSEAKDVRYDFIKIDAQGSEYNIIKGSDNFLRSTCLGLHLELFIFPLYRGIKLFSKVNEMLKKYNFIPVKIYPAHGSFYSQHDVVFFRKNTKGAKINLLRKIYDIDN